MLMPSHAKRVQPYRDPGVPLFNRFQIEADRRDVLTPGRAAEVGRLHRHQPDRGPGRHRRQLGRSTASATSRRRPQHQPGGGRRDRPPAAPARSRRPHRHRLHRHGDRQDLAFRPAGDVPSASASVARRIGTPALPALQWHGARSAAWNRWRSPYCAWSARKPARIAPPGSSRSCRWRWPITCSTKNGSGSAPSRPRDNLQVILVANPDLETPNYSIRRVRDDQLALPENSAVSYQLVGQATEESASGDELAAPKPQPQAPAVASILPVAPAPAHIPRETATIAVATPGLLTRLRTWLFGSNPPAAETDSNSRDNGERRPRTESSAHRGRSDGRAQGRARGPGGGDRPAQQRRGNRPPRREQRDGESSNRNQDANRQPDSRTAAEPRNNDSRRPEPRDNDNRRTEQAAGENPQAEGRNAGNEQRNANGNRSERSRRGRRRRGGGGGGGDRDNQGEARASNPASSSGPAINGTDHQAAAAPVVSVSPQAQTPLPTAPAPAPAPAPAQEPATVTLTAAMPAPEPAPAPRPVAAPAQPSAVSSVTTHTVWTNRDGERPDADRDA
jgi:hypothetical protein